MARSGIATLSGAPAAADRAGRRSWSRCRCSGGGWLLLRHSSLVLRRARAGERARGGAWRGHGCDRNGADGRRARHEHARRQPRGAAGGGRAYPIVGAVRVHPSFPHGLRIEVIERPPVAALIVGGASTAVAADGVVLGPGFLSSSLPLVSAGQVRCVGRLDGASDLHVRHCRHERCRRSGQRPRRARCSGRSRARRRTRRRSRMRSRASTEARRASRWRCAAACSRTSATRRCRTRSGCRSRACSPTRARRAPSYVDVRLPERPAAGFAPGTSRPDASSTELESSGASSDPNTAAELASGLDAAVGGGSGSGLGQRTSAAAARAPNRAPAAKQRSRAQVRLKPDRAGFLVHGRSDEHFGVLGSGVGGSLGNALRERSSAG